MTGTRRHAGLPRGTVTLLFTDIEGSTRALRALGPAYGEALARHRRIVREACVRHHGHEVDTQGDAFLVVFGRATEAVAAAAEAQVALDAEQWPDDTALRVRIGIHTGEPELDDEGYLGLDVHLAARICAAAHGGQILISRATRDLVGAEPVPGGSVRDLGEHRLKDFEAPERLFQVDIPGLPTEHPPPRTASSVGLLVPSNRLVGREPELAELRELFSRPDVRVVTLTGPGGTGKSRLALEHAWEAVERFSDGVVFVRLAPVVDAELVPSEIATALGVRDSGSRSILDVVGDHLAERELLLVVDNVEHVIEAAPLLSLLFERAPALRILATSRVPLRLRGEHVLDVEPLPPDDAASLFVERARAADRRFDPDAESETVAAICRRLDGLPLAIELAAARIAVLTPAALLERLGLALLSGGATDLPERQQTLSATIDWSYELLTASQRDLHESLSVFAGGCTLEAAEAVCGPDGLLDDLAALVSGGLLRREDAGGEPRFRMLQVVREFAAERLDGAGRADELGSRHADWVAELAEEAEAELPGPNQAEWLARLEREMQNVRSALDWSLAHGRADLTLRIASSLGRFWRAHGHMTEAREWLLAGLTAGEDVDRELRARALWAAARQAMAQSDGAAAVPFLEEALELFRATGATRDVVFTQSELGWAAIANDDLEAAARYGQEALATARAADDDRALASALSALAAVASASGDRALARAHGEEILAIRRRLGDPMLVANAANNVGVDALSDGDVARAREALEEALTIAVHVGDAIHTAAALCGLGQTALVEGDHDRAGRLLAESLGQYIALSDDRSAAECVACLAAAATAAGRFSDAARLFGAADVLHARSGGPDAIETRVVEGFRETASRELGTDVFAALASDCHSSPAEVLADLVDRDLSARGTRE